MSTHEVREILAALDDDKDLDDLEDDMHGESAYGMQTNTVFSKRMYRRR